VKMSGRREFPCRVNESIDDDIKKISFENLGRSYYTVVCWAEFVQFGTDGDRTGGSVMVT